MFAALGVWPREAGRGALVGDDLDGPLEGADGPAEVVAAGIAASAAEAAEAASAAAFRAVVVWRPWLGPGTGATAGAGARVGFFFLRPRLPLEVLDFAAVGFFAVFRIVLEVVFVFFFGSVFSYCSSRSLWGGLMRERLRRLYAMIGSCLIDEIERMSSAPFFMQFHMVESRAFWMTAFVRTSASDQICSFTVFVRDIARYRDGCESE